MNNYLPHTWVNPKLIGKISSIHGQGVITQEKIAEGETLMVFGGEYLSKAEVFSGKYRSKTIWPIDEQNYLALPKTDTSESLDENLNHSCDANSWLQDEVTLVAKHPIDTGDEITLDQGTWNFEDDAYTDNGELCFCNSTDCRKNLTKEDWKLQSVRIKYNTHFHPVIQKMIDDELADGLPSESKTS
jgi:hypothetical protein